jgi:hypothetical protein
MLNNRLTVLCKSAFVCLLICFVTWNTHAQSTVTIGTGTATDYNFPFQPYFNNGWSSQIYTATEIGTAGTINSLAFYVNNSSGSYTLDNQKIYVRHTSVSQHADKYYPGTTGFTLVYSGSITFGTSGWKTINLSSPFAYNGTNNLEVLIESRDGSTFTSALQTRYTSKSEYRTKYDYNDYNFPTTWYAGGRVTKLPNIQFVINTCSVVAGTVSTTTPSICSGGSASLTLSGQTSGQTIQWQTSADNSTFTDIAGANAATYTTPVLTTASYYRAKVGSGSCIVTSSSQSIAILSLPTAPTVGSNSPVCGGGSLNLTASTIAGASYAWTGPNGFISSLQNPSIQNVSNSATGVYSVVSIVNGCLSTAVATTVTITSQITAPTVSNNGPLCAGSQLTLNASSISGASYSWSGPNGFTSNLQSPIVSNSSTITMSGDYILTIQFGSCPSVTTLTSVLVKDIPSSPQVVSTHSVCQGDNLILTGESNSFSTYEWVGPNNFTSTLLNVVVASQVTTIHDGVYTLYSIVDGCKSIGATTTVNVISLPQVNAGANTSIELGSSSTLGSTPTVGYTYLWNSIPSGFSSTLSNPNVSPTSTTTYTLVVTNASGCSNSGSVTISVTVPPLQVTFKVLNNSCSVDNSGAIETTVTGGVSPYTFKWNTGHDTKSISGIGIGNYTLEVTDASIPSQKVTKSVALSTSPEWQYIKGLKYTNDGVLLKTSSTGNENSWASSTNSFIGDGWISYKITSKSTKYMIGFSKAHHKEGNHDLGTPIDYGIEQDYSQDNLYKANSANSYTTYQIGDVVKISREGASIKYYKNGVLLTSFTDIVNPSTVLYLEVTMTDLNSSLEDLKINFCNADESDLKNISYARPLRKLDGGFYETDKGVLRFIFEEEYAVSSNSILNYVIYDKQKNEVIRSLGGGSCVAPTINVGYGFNKIELNFSNVTCLNTGDYYIIEMKNSKNESVFMRFKYEI